MADRVAAELAIDLTRRETFSYWNAHVIRFADLDAAGHVNNLAFGAFFEAGRVAFMETAGVPTTAPDITTMIVRMAIDYLSQMDFPGDVEVGTRALRLGRSSCVLGQGLFRDGACVATSEAVSVLVDRTKDRSTPFPDPMRNRILALSGD